MRLHTAFVLGALVASEATLLTACSRPTAPTLPDAKLYLRGPVASVKAGTRGAPAEVLVQRPDGCGIRAFITARTAVLRRSAAGVTSGAALADVGVGDTAEVYVAGPVALSCPAQAEASSLVLVGAAGL